MISYDASSLDSNRTLLQEFHKIEDYLKKNPVYKCYALQDDYVVGTSQYSIADLVASESELAEGDVVIFANAYVGFVSSVGEEYFSVINVVNVKGPQGPQGIQGPQGPAGADGQDGTDGTNGVDGKPVLWYNLEVAVASQEAFITMLSESSHTFTKNYFSRVGEYGDEFMAFVNVHNGNVYEQYIMLYKILTWTEGVGTCTAQYQQVYARITGNKGDDGSAGPSALCYDRNIAFTRSADAEQLISVTLPFANFNRTPELNQDFVGILEDSGVCYIAQCEVQTISGTNVTSIVASDILKVTGADGQNGTNGTDGTDGKDALVLQDVYTHGGQVPVVNQVIDTYLFTQYFNRTPVVNEYFLMIYPYNSRSWILNCVVSGLSGSYVTATVKNVVETTGEAGGSLTQYSVTFSTTLTANDYAHISRIIRNAKGNVTFKSTQFGNGVGTFAYDIDNTNNPVDFTIVQVGSYSRFLHCTIYQDGSTYNKVGKQIDSNNVVSDKTVDDDSFKGILYYYNDSQIA